MSLLHRSPHTLCFSFKCVNKLSYPRSLLFPAARENVVMISEVRQSIKRWKFHLLQSFGLYRVCLPQRPGPAVHYIRIRRFETSAIWKRGKHNERGICKWSETGKPRAYRLPQYRHMLSSESCQSVCLHPSSHNKQVFNFTD